MIEFIKKHDFVYGLAENISPLITRITARNPGSFTFNGTGTFLIGKNNIALIDPGPDLAEHEKAIITALRGRKLTHILLTHNHLDHSALAPKLSNKFSCPVYGMKTKAKTHNLPDIKLEEGENKNFMPDIEIKDGDMFCGDNWSLKAMHTPGHTSNHICFALVEENALFTGDHIMGWATSVVIPPDGDMAKYLKSLKRVYDIGFDKLYPTHGSAINNPQTFIKSYIAHRLERERQILLAIENGCEKIPEIVRLIYKDIDKRLYPAAGISVLSHLIKLVQEKRVQCDTTPSLNSTYSR